MSRTPGRAPTTALFALLLAVGLLGGCGVSSADKPSSAASDSASPGATGSATPSQTATQSPGAAPSPTLAPQAALLTSQEMPRINDQLSWRPVRTGPVSSNAFGLCAKFDVLSIGAEQAVERSFVAGPVREHVFAGEQIATFPDSTTVARAEKVLESWHRSCSARLPGTHRKVSPIETVPVPTGRAWWYLVSYVPSQVGTGSAGAGGIFHAFGVVVAGNRMSMLRMEAFGQDHNYPPGQDPMQLAVKAAAGKLG